MRPLHRHIIKFLSALLIIGGVVWFLSYVEPAEIIERFGERNTYIAVFILAMIGGVSALSAAGFYATLFSLALGGADPFILALFSAPGVLIGDLVFWSLGVQGKYVLEDKYEPSLKKFSSWLAKKPKWFVSAVVYIYTGFTPFPGDFLMVALAVLNYRFRQIFVPTILGNYTLALIVALSARYSFW
jgi:membrane protein YqaA with SNARE-associated domain